VHDNGTLPGLTTYTRVYVLLCGGRCLVSLGRHKANSAGGVCTVQIRKENVACSESRRLLSGADASPHALFPVLVTGIQPRRVHGARDSFAVFPGSGDCSIASTGGEFAPFTSPYSVILALEARMTEYGGALCQTKLPTTRTGVLFAVRTHGGWIPVTGTGMREDGEASAPDNAPR
jgi:hypothetical protein